MAAKQARSDDSQPAAPAALLIIDMINDLCFPEGEALLKPALDAARRISALKARLRAGHIPAIYVNDNFGRWRSNFAQAVEHCLRDDVPGSALAKELKPTEEDYFVLKPQHSAFYATPLELLLDHLQTRTLILTGISGHMCIQFTASDAYMRKFTLLTPPDCIASHTPELNQQCLDYMHEVLGAELTPSTGIDPTALSSAG